MKRITLIIGSMIVGGIISAAGFTWFAKAEPPAEKTSAAERRILFWYDPMYPNTRFGKPGKSPLMDMDLVPKYAGEEGSASGVRIDPTRVQNLGAKVATVTREPLTFAQSFPANVGYNKYQYAIMQAHAAEFIDKVYPLTVGDKVQKGAPLLDLTTLNWVEAQSKYLLLHGIGGTTTQAEGILERLRLARIPEVDIHRLIATRKIQTRFTLKAPIDGVITVFDLCAGMDIAKDNVVAKIQGMDPMWITAAVPEPVAWLVKDASQSTFTVPARPDKTLTIRRWTLLSGVGAATRMLQLRLEVDDTDETLKPGMNAWLQLNTASEPMLLIPSQALINTGNEQWMIIVNADGRFVSKRVAVFQASQGVTALHSGLAEDEEVVSNDLFLIGSEADISGALERMCPESTTYAH